MRWLRLARRCCAHSKGVLGRCYVYGAGVTQDVARGLALGSESEAAGSCFGQVVVGRSYYDAQDDAEAVRLYRLSAVQGHAEAQMLLGFMFERGQGVARDIAEAILWYRLAAAQGDIFAENQLKQLGA